MPCDTRYYLFIIELLDKRIRGARNQPFIQLALFNHCPIIVNNKGHIVCFMHEITQNAFKPIMLGHRCVYRKIIAPLSQFNVSCSVRKSM